MVAKIEVVVPVGMLVVVAALVVVRVVALVPDMVEAVALVSMFR